MPPKQIARREPGDNATSDSFDHLTRPVRDHGLVWGAEPLRPPTPPKGRDDIKEPRWQSMNDRETNLECSPRA